MVKFGYSWNFTCSVWSSCNRCAMFDVTGLSKYERILVDSIVPATSQVFLVATLHVMMISTHKKKTDMPCMASGSKSAG